MMQIHLLQLEETQEVNRQLKGIDRNCKKEKTVYAKSLAYCITHQNFLKFTANFGNRTAELFRRANQQLLSLLPHALWATAATKLQITRMGNTNILRNCLIHCDTFYCCLTSRATAVAAGASLCVSFGPEHVWVVVNGQGLVIWV